MLPESKIIVQGRGGFKIFKSQRVYLFPGYNRLLGNPESLNPSARMSDITDVNRNNSTVNDYSLYICIDYICTVVNIC